MRIIEGQVFNDTKSVLNYHYNDGYCMYKHNCVILSLDFYKSEKRRTNDVIPGLRRRAQRDGFEFPNTFLPDYKWFLCKPDGTPYNYSGKETVKDKDPYRGCYFSTLEDLVKVLKSNLNESLKEKIRFALKEDSVAKRNTRWNPDTQPNIYQLDVFLRKSGYRLIDVVDNEGHPEPIIESMKEGHLHPDITYSVADQTFYVEVKKYGQLIYSDLEEVVKGYQTAIGVLKRLDDLDLSKLEYKESEEEHEEGSRNSNSKETPGE